MTFRKFLEIMFGVASDFEYGFACGIIFIIGLIVFIVVFVYSLDFFSDLSDMRKEYNAQKEKELEEIDKEK